MDKYIKEFSSSPFNTVINQIRERPHGAHGNSFFFRVLRIWITLSLIWKNQLRVAFCTKSTWFEKRFTVQYAFSVNVFSCVNIIYCVYNKGKRIPKDIGKLTFTFSLHSTLSRIYIEFFVELTNYIRCCFTFGFSNMMRAEEELAVQIGNFYLVIINNSELSTWRTTESSEGENFQVLTTKSSSTNHEDMFSSNFFEEFFTKESIVGTISWVFEFLRRFDLFSKISKWFSFE